MPFDIKRDVIEGLGVEELVMIPFDKDFSTIDAEEFCRGILVDTPGRDEGRGRGELPLRQAGEGRPGDAASRARSSRPRWCRWWRSTARRSRRPGSGRRSPPATSRARCAASGRRSCSRATVVEGDKRGPHARLPDRERGPRRGLRLSRATASTPRSRTGSRRRSTSACARRSRPAAGVLIESYLIDHERRPLRPDAADRVHRPAARREALRGRGRAGRPDAPRRGRGARACVPSSHHLANLSDSAWA